MSKQWPLDSLEKRADEILEKTPAHTFSDTKSIGIALMKLGPEDELCDAFNAAIRNQNPELLLKTLNRIIRDEEHQKLFEWLRDDPGEKNYETLIDRKNKERHFCSIGFYKGIEKAASREQE